MRIKTLLVCVTAAAMLAVGVPGAAQADPDNIVATGTDVDVTSNACFPAAITITGMNRIGSAYVVQVSGPTGDVGYTTSWGGYANTPPLVTEFCSDHIEGHYNIAVDGTVYGGFDVYRPRLDVAAPAGARFKGKRHVVSAVLSIHGKRMAHTPVKVRKHVSGKRGFKTTRRTTDASGRVRAVCPKGHRCTVQFNYGNGFTLSRVVRVGRH